MHAWHMVALACLDRGDTHPAAVEASETLGSGARTDTNPNA
jgi:hypothetical protein